MPSTRSDRLFAAAGLLFPVLMITGFIAFPKTPGGDVSAAHDPVWLAAHSHAVIAQCYVRAFAAVAFIALSVAVAKAISARGDAPVLSKLIVAGGTASAMLTLLAQAVTLGAVLALRDGATADVMHGLDGLNDATLSLSSLPAVLMFAAAAVGFGRSQEFPRWLTIFSAAGVPLAVVDAASYDGGPLASVGILGLAYFLLWSLATAVHLTRHSGGATAQGRSVAATAAAS
ncbi:MAG: hypothetical protein ACRDV3_10065 [Acidothermaceae bacterium]